MTQNRTRQAQARAAVYVRVSDPKQEDNNSRLTQEQEIRAYCGAQGYTVDDAHIYREVHRASELWQRPELTRLRRAAQTGAFDVVVMHCVDRFSRNQAHAYIVAYELEQQGQRLEFAIERFEETAIGRFMRSAKSFAAEVELERIRERTTRGVHARAEAGKVLSGPRPVYGYRFVDDPVPPGTDERTVSRTRKVRYEVEEQPATWVRWMFDQVRRGVPVRRIEAGLTAASVPRPSGKPGPWSHSAVLWILKNRAYTGEAHAWQWTTAKNSKGKETMTRRPESEWVRLPDGTVPALVDPATFDAVQQQLAANKQRAARNNKDPEMTLLRGGYARCGVCDGALIVRRWKGRRPDGTVIVTPTYRCAAARAIGSECHHSISAAVLDAAAWARVAELLEHPETIAAHLERTRANDPTEADLAATERALTAITREQRIYVENLGKVTGAAADLIAQKVNVLEKQREQLAAEREGILARRGHWAAALERVHDLEAWCRQAAANLPTMTYQDRRQALDVFAITARVWPKGHTPRYDILANIKGLLPDSCEVVDSTGCGIDHNGGVLLRWTDSDPVAVQAAADRTPVLV